MIDDPGYTPSFTTTRSYEPDDVIFNEGDPDTGFFILLSGTIDVVKQGRRLGSISEASTIFGEVGPILGKERTCKLQAGSHVTVLHIPMTIEQLFEERPKGWEEFVKALLRALAERVDSASDRYINRPTIPPWMKR